MSKTVDGSKIEGGEKIVSRRKNVNERKIGGYAGGR